MEQVSRLSSLCASLSFVFGERVAINFSYYFQFLSCGICHQREKNLLSSDKFQRKTPSSALRLRVTSETRNGAFSFSCQLTTFSGTFTETCELLLHLYPNWMWITANPKAILCWFVFATVAKKEDVWRKRLLGRTSQKHIAHQKSSGNKFLKMCILRLARNLLHAI